MNKVENIELNEDGISLADIVDFAQKSWKTVALWSAIGLIGGAGYAFVATPKYLATANIQSAMVAGAGLTYTSGANATGKVAYPYVESPALLVEKLKQPSYYSKPIFEACDLSDGADSGSILANALKPTLVKNVDLVSISYKAKSQDVALGCINAVSQSVAKNQENIAKPLLDARKAELSSLEQKANAVQKLEEITLNKNSVGNFNDSRFLVSSLLITTANDLATQIRLIKSQLLPPQTSPTEATVYVSPKPVEPRKLIVILGGLFGGAVLSVVYLLARTQIRKLSKT
jgi:capsular polysaccharide biosynthesis protein